MKTTATFFISVTILCAQQAKVDDKPPINGKFWLYHHYVDAGELSYIYQYRELAETYDDFAVCDKGVVDQLLGTKTVKMANKHFFLESDYFVAEQLKWIGGFLEQSNVFASQLLSTSDALVDANLRGKKYSLLFLVDRTRDRFLDEIETDEGRRRFRKRLFATWFEHASTTGRAWRFVVPTDSSQNDVERNLIWAANSATAAFASDMIFSQMGTSSNRISEVLGRCNSILHGFGGGDTGVSQRDTGERSEVSEHVFPDWINSVLNDARDSRKKDTFRLRNIMAGSYDGMDASVTLRLWAFFDWLMLARRDKLRDFLKELREKVTAFKKENKDVVPSTEQMKRMEIESLEKVFGKDIDAIETDFKTYVEERYFTSEQAKKIEKHLLYKTPQYKPK